MEFLSALLTAVLLWLFLLHVATGARRRVRQRAGDLLVRWTRPRSRTARIFLWVVFVLLVASGVLPIVMAYVLLGAIDSLHLFKLAFFLPMIVLPSLVLQTMEIRQQGIVRTAGLKAIFTPWAAIDYCKWTRRPGNLQVQLHHWRQEYFVRNEQVDSVTSALCRFVEVRDENGVVVAPQARQPEGPAAREDAQPEVHRFQFGLSTLLFFMVVASSAFSWYGIRYRREQQQQQALAEFDRFQPWTMATLDDVWLDFSSSPSKPCDADLSPLRALPELISLDLGGAPVTDDGLTCLEGLPRLHRLGLSRTSVTDAGLAHVGQLRSLRNLDLSGTRITDAGLVHLERLSKLRRLSLRTTRVTDDGVQRLQEALPKVEIRR
jgi:hypothetical protein